MSKKLFYNDFYSLSHYSILAILPMTGIRPQILTLPSEPSPLPSYQVYLGGGWRGGEAPGFVRTRRANLIKLQSHLITYPKSVFDISLFKTHTVIYCINTNFYKLE